MKICIYICVLLTTFCIFADTPPPSNIKIKGGTDSTIIGNSGDALHVYGLLGKTWNLNYLTDSVTSYQGSTWSVGVNNFPSVYPVTGTFWQTTQPISGTVTANAGTNLNTSALNLETTQSGFKTANHTDLGTLNSTLGSPFQAGGSIGNTTFASTQSGNWNMQYNPVNSAGSHTTGTVSTVITLTAPANAIGFTLQAKDSNTANMRYAIGATATTSVGMQLQPGRDSGYQPIGANISIVSESGTQEYEILWALTH